MKYCVKCSKTKLEKEFYKNSLSKDSLTTYCKECMTNYRNLNRQKNINYQKTRRENENNKVCLQRRKSYRNLTPEKKILAGLKNRAKRKGLEFNITEKDIKIPKICPYLKTEFQLGVKNNYQYSYSIDRIDNSKGYIKNNIEIISMKANSMKNNATPKELINFALEIIKRYKDDDIVQTILKNIESQDKEPVR